MSIPSFTDDTLDNITTVSDGKVWRPIRPVSRIALTNIQNRIKKVEAKTSAIANDPDTPKQVANVIVVESPSKQQDRTFSAVSVQFTRNASDAAFAGVKIWLTGYKGNSNPVLVTDGADSPITFLVETTNEIVLVTVQAFGTSGKVADFAGAPTASVKLDGVISAPPAPSIAQSLVGTPLGYQFSFNQLSAQIADVIQAYRIYRNTTNASGTASLIQTIPHDPTNAGSVVVTDMIVPALGSTYFYWVSAVNTSGLESTLTAAQVGTVVGSIGSVPPSFSGAFTYAATTTTITWSWLSNQVIYRADNEATQIPAGTQAITGLTAGTTYYFYPYYDEAASALKWLDAAHVSFPAMTGVLLNGTTGYVRDTANETIGISHGFELFVKTTAVTQQGLLDTSAPSIIGTFTAGTFQCVMNSTGTVSASVINTVPAVKTATSVAKINDGNWHQVAFVGNAAAATLTLYIDGVQDGQATAIGTINAASNIFIHAGAVHGRTSFPATANVFFNGAISHVSWYNEGANGALTAAMVAEHYQMAINQGMPALESAVDHDPNFAFMFWPLTDTSGTVAVDTHATRNGTYTGGVTLNQSSTFMVPKGTPGIAWPLQTFLASQAQNARNLVPLSSGAISAATPASGSGGGTGGGSFGGGRGGCFSGSTRVKTPRGDMPISEIQIGDEVLTAAGTWRPVLAVIRHEPYEAAGVQDASCQESRSESGAWRMLSLGKDEGITVNHCTLDGFWKRAYEVLEGTVFLHHGPVFNLKIDSRTNDPMATDTEASFTLVANGLVVHNINNIPK